MVDPLPIQGPSPADAPSAPEKTRDAGSGGPAFESLLEQLEAKAHELAERSRGLTGPSELAGAVDTARSSLEDALTLRDRLLEEYRQAQQQSDVGPTEESA